MKHLKPTTLIRADALSNLTNGIYRLWNEPSGGKGLARLWSDFTVDIKEDFSL